MVVIIKDAKGVMNLYRNTLNNHSEERNLLDFQVRGETVTVSKSYDRYKENLIGFLKSIGIPHKITRYK